MADLDKSDKSGFLQPNAPPPPYQDPAQYPNTGYPPPGNTFAYQPHGGPVGPYGTGPYPGYHAVVVQPTVYVTAAPLVSPLPDYLGYSIFTMLCCCLPLGIAALIYSISTRNANMTGQPQIAEKNSKMALTLNHVALGIGLTIIVLYITIIIVSIA
nr:transmembrane protein 91-like [Misgurnus anguillicaudatus]